MRTQFRNSMMAYSALGMLAFLTLSGKIRMATLILLAGFAVKTWMAELRRKQGE